MTKFVTFEAGIRRFEGFTLFAKSIQCTGDARTGSLEQESNARWQELALYAIAWGFVLSGKHRLSTGLKLKCKGWMP
jgi:hypothetical protein